MAFLATNLVQAILSELGQTEPFFGIFEATGGSATTFVNANFANFENPPEQDVFKNYLAIVVRDTGGLSPEGKWGNVTAYADATWTGTFTPTMTDSIASGDTVMLAKQDKFPLQQILFAINRGLESLGDLPTNADVSLTTVASQTEYDIPVAVKRGLKQVWIQGRTNDSNDNQWYQVHDRRNDLTSAGSASVLYIPQYPAGRTIRLIYDGTHAVVTAYSSVINEYVHPNVAIAASIVKLLEWYNHRDENQSESYFAALEQEYKQIKLPLALAMNPIQRPRRTPKYATFGREDIDRPPESFL